MGCISSKQARSEFHDAAAFTVSSASRKSRRRVATVRVANSAPLDVRAVFGPLEKIKEESEWEVEEEEDEGEEEKKNDGYSGNLRDVKKVNHEKKGGFFSIRFGKMSEGEQVAAGWPAWLSAVAGDAIDGMLPLKTEKFERLEKIGQGTYSDVYRARDLETGKIVALKKVRFDNFQPESVRFMAREILILRKLNHPNIMKLEGIITSRVSSSIHLVFEYMEHDLAGLVSCPEIKFTDSQIKCYMLQLLRGIEHCHSNGVMHRDIKTSNILVNNEGVLKIGDFGLANYFRPKNKQPLTSRVVTLWYRPPELLLGSTNYGEAVDLWSVGCVFAELFIGRPILKGRTEVEQLHKIFKLCGSPSDEYWKKCRLPLASMFKPQQPYESTLGERCKELPKSAVKLIEMLLSIEPYDRGTASFAMASEYFATKPYACDPSRMPKYPPNKEIDAKLRENARRKTSRVRTGSRHSRRIHLLQESGDFIQVIPTEDATANNQVTYGNEYKRRMRTESRSYLSQRYDTMSEASQTTQESQVSTTLSVPAHVTASGFAWAKKQKKSDLIRRIRAQQQQQSSRSQQRITLGSYLEESYDSTDTSMENMQSHQPDSFDSSDIYEPRELSREYIIKKKKSRVGFSAPLVQPYPEMPPNQIGQRRELHRSRFYKDL